MDGINLPLLLHHHQAIRRPDKGDRILDVRFKLGGIEEIGVNGIVACSPLRRVAVCGWPWCWWLLCWHGRCLRRGKLCDIAVELEIDHLAVEISMIAFKVDPTAVDLEPGVHRFVVLT